MSKPSPWTDHARKWFRCTVLELERKATFGPQIDGEGFCPPPTTTTTTTTATTPGVFVSGSFYLGVGNPPYPPDPPLPPIGRHPPWRLPTRRPSAGPSGRCRLRRTPRTGGSTTSDGERPGDPGDPFEDPLEWENVPGLWCLRVVNFLKIHWRLCSI